MKTQSKFVTPGGDTPARSILQPGKFDYITWRGSARRVFDEWSKEMSKEQFQDVPNKFELVLNEILTRLDKIDNKMQELLEEEFYEEAKPRPSKETQVTDFEFVTDDDIRKYGNRIPYNRIDSENDKQIFRNFCNYIIMNEGQFTKKENDYAGYAAEKDFSDIRLSDNSRRVLGTAYQRTHKKQWSIMFVRGSMIKYRNQIAWTWADGRDD